MALTRGDVEDVLALFNAAERLHEDYGVTVLSSVVEMNDADTLVRLAYDGGLDGFTVEETSGD